MSDLVQKKKIIDCYVFSVLNYGCESLTWNKALFKKINAFEMWCYMNVEDKLEGQNNQCRSVTENAHKQWRAGRGGRGGQGPNRMTPKRAPKWHPKGAKIGIFAPPKMSFDEIYVTAPKAPLGLLNALAKGKQFLLKCI